MSVEQLYQRAKALAEENFGWNCPILGICGPPGAGKSLLAQNVAKRIPRSVVVAMDGFHFSQDVLREAGTLGRKGAPETFNAKEYVETLERISEGDELYAPRFDRKLEEPIANAVHVGPRTDLVITEGNYLLLDESPWNEVRSFCEEIWYLDVPEESRLQWLIERHEKYGRTHKQATARAHGTDQRNAELVAKTKHRAKVIITAVR